jgi:hypothetical protein
MCTEQVPTQHTGSDAAKDFLLQEHAAIEADTQRLRQEGATRLNILVVLIGVSSAAAISAVTSDRFSTAAKESIGLGAFVSILIYTLLCYKNFIDREITTDSNFRALSRIRRYFVDLYPTVARHVSWDTHDGATHQLTRNRSFVLASVRHLVGVQVASAAVVGSHGRGLNDIGGGFVAVGAYGLSVTALWLWSRRRFRSAGEEAATRARFPSGAHSGSQPTRSRPVAKEPSQT